MKLKAFQNKYDCISFHIGPKEEVLQVILTRELTNNVLYGPQYTKVILTHELTLSPFPSIQIPLCKNILQALMICFKCETPANQVVPP